eukprot:SAG31_NODE_843_length_11551_cov_6.757772_8_plen_61_part_00
MSMAAAATASGGRPQYSAAFGVLCKHLQQLARLNQVVALVDWDQQVMAFNCTLAISYHHS